MNNNNIRLHIPAVPYTITTDEYSHDAYCGKVKRFSPMLRSRGFEVYHYGIETSESGANVQIDLMTKEEWTDLRIKSFQFAFPNISIDEARKKHYDPAEPIAPLWNLSSPLIIEFNKRLKIKLKENYRSLSTDIVCLPLASTHNPSMEGLNCVAIETGIGYKNPKQQYRIYESYAWLSNDLGLQDKDPSNYSFVIPNYFDINEFTLSLNPTPLKIGFLGRLGGHKGCSIIVELAKLFPNIEFILCGSGDPTPFLKHPNIKYKSPIHGKERSDYLGSCIAVLCISKYLEPFCGVAVEAQLCGTPVICSDWGGMVETVEQFKTGLRGHTLADYVYGIKMVLDGKFDRNYIRNRAADMFDMYKLANNYEYVFKTVLNIHNGKGGWYSTDTNIPVLINDSLNPIPFKIWQTWKTKDLPEKMKECVDKLKNEHPNFEHNLFDDNDCYEFIKKYFPIEVLLAYDALIPGAYKADLWRLCVLYIHGGVYMDIKLQFCEGYNLNRFMNKEYFANAGYLEHNEKRIGIYNAFMICKKNNPILLKSIINIVYNVTIKYYGRTPYSITGPLLIGKIFETSEDKPCLSLIHYGPKYSETIRLSNDEIVCEHYKEYRMEQRNVNVKHYEQLWIEKNIYNEKQCDLINIYNNNMWSIDFKKLLKNINCTTIDEVTKHQIKLSNIEKYESELFKVYNFDNKIRLGRNYDGGYVIGDLNNIYDCYISAGISMEESFSRDFISKYNMNKNNCFAFDGTIKDYPWEYTKDITFINKNIGDINNEKITNLHDLLDTYKNIFIKMDIESDEYPWLFTLTDNQLSNIAQITLELHGIYMNDKYTWEEKIKCFEKLNNNFYLIHIHANNYHYKFDKKYPEEIEFTYINKKFLIEPTLNKKQILIENLDFPNNRKFRDYNIDYYPFSQTDLNEVRILLGSSNDNIKKINIPEFLLDDYYNIELEKNKWKDSFSFKIEDKKLVAKRLDNSLGWNYSHYVIFKKIQPMNDSIVLFIGSSINNIKKVEIPDELLKEKYIVSLSLCPYKDTFSFEIEDKLLIIKRLDTSTGWDYNHSVIFKKDNSLILSIGSSINNIKKIKIPDELLKEKYTVSLSFCTYRDTFSFEIEDKLLIIKRLDTSTGWDYNHSVIFKKDNTLI